MTLSPYSTSTAYLEMFFNEQLLACGTGCFIKFESKTYIATARHNLTGRGQNTNNLLSKEGAIPNILAYHHTIVDTKGRVRLASNKIDLFDSENNPTWFEHPKFGSKVDVVLIDCGNFDLMLKKTNSSLHCINRMGEDNLIHNVSSKVCIIGFPFGDLTNKKLPIWTTGYMASEPDIWINDEPKFLIDARTRQGQSGAPVILHYVAGTVHLFDDDIKIARTPVGKFLGIYSGRINKDSDIGIVWRASVIDDILNSIK